MLFIFIYLFFGHARNRRAGGRGGGGEWSLTALQVELVPQDMWLH